MPLWDTSRLIWDILIKMPIRHTGGTPMRRTISVFLFSLLLASAWVSPARGASYTFTTIDVRGGINTQANGINDAGQIVGTFVSGSPQKTRGFLLRGSHFTTIDVPDSSASSAQSINNRG